MESVTIMLRTCGLLLYIIFQIHAAVNNIFDYTIHSIKVDRLICDVNNCKYLLNVYGGEFLGHYSWRLTPKEGVKGGSCDVTYPNYVLKEIETAQWLTKLEILVPNSDEKIFFCLHYNTKNAPFGGKWVHQGVEHFLDPKNNVVPSKNRELTAKDFPQPSEQQANTKNSDLQDNITEWEDLSHDTDVNYLPNVPRPTREEKNDIEVMFNSKYVPLNTFENVQTHFEDANINIQDFDNTISNNIGRFKREKILNTNEALNKVGQSDELLVDDKNKINDEEILKCNKSGLKSFSVSKKEHGHNSNGSSIHVIKVENGNQTNFLEPFVSKVFNEDIELTDKIRKPRQVSFVPEITMTTVKADPVAIFIEGIRIEDSDKEPKIIDGGIPSVLADSGVTLRIFGQGLTSRTVIAFTHDEQEYGQPCKFLLKGEYMVKEDSLKSRTALFEVTAPAPINGEKLYICAKNLKPGIIDPAKDEEKYMHQGTETWKMFASHTSLLPLWVSLTLILVCLMFSALFSGLNLGLMSLDRTELKIISNTGTEQERKYARAIMPVRDHGNYLLCSILLGNVAVNSTFTILLDELTSGLFAVIFSTLAIVLLGEITPQAICSRHGLMVGAKSIMITKAVMALTAPLAFPVSKLLDYFLGEEIGSVYNRERLKELVKITTDVNDLDNDEVNIISGALELRKKTVSDVMTKLEDVFMLPISSVLDFETMSEIVKSGYSRIPVYEGSRGNIVTVLFIKDLAFVDPDDNTPLRTLCQYYQNPCNFVFEDVTLDVMFRQFKEGHKGHMAFVHRINNEGEGDPFYETIGLVTLEDVIEEMIQAEIVDETDVFMDNRTKRRRNRPQNKLQDFAAFAERHENQRIHISPQLTLATFQFLSTSVDAFRPDTVSETVLRRLLKQDVIHHIKLKGKTKKDPSTYVFQQGKPVDYFVLILEGRVEVTVGRENLVFEAGPFTYFGVQALTQNVGLAESPTPSAMGSLQNINMDAMLRHTFVPDYSVRAITELFYLTVKSIWDTNSLVQMLCIYYLDTIRPRDPQSLYLAAKRATLMEKGALSKGATNEQFDTEVDKHLCNSSSANIPISMISKKLLGKSTSTVSTKDVDVLDPTTVINKLSPRINIIELMQVTQQNYPSSERLDANSDKYLSKLPPNTCDSVKRWSNSETASKPYMVPNIATKSFTNAFDNFKYNTEASKSCSSACGTTKCWPNCDMYGKSSSKYSTKDIDAIDCAECVENNFWMTILNKSAVDSKVNEPDHCKKKKTTFHTDSSLLSFHNLTPTSQEQIDSNLIPEIDVNRDIDYKSISQDAEAKMSPDSSGHFDRLLEFERDTIDYTIDRQWRDERLAIEKRRLETEQLMLLLQSVDEDISISGEHKTPSRQVSPHPLPVSASPATRSTFVAHEPRNGDVYARPDEQEKLLK